MIRQAISCDICGAEKKQTNHWFVASTHGGELRVAGWKTDGRMRAGDLVSEPHHLLRSFHGCRVGELDIGHQVAHVL